jgi:hypothetical protein
VPADASAVAVNVTATGGTHGSFVTVWPHGEGMPTASTINFAAGQNIANMVIVEVGEDGKVDLYNHRGDVDVIFDVVGYFPEGTDFDSFSPERVLDTRDSTGDVDGPIGRREVVSQQVAGVGSVPADASAVAVNVTATGGTHGSFVTVWPHGEGMPTASTINFAAGQNIANMVIVEVGEDGKVDLYNHRGDVDVIFDVVGYFPEGTDFDSFSPERVLDTRDSTGDVDGPIGRREVVSQQVAGVGSVPADASAVAVNVTATGGTHGSFVTVWPHGEGMPTASTINFAAGQNIANMVIVEVGEDGKVDLYNHRGDVDVIFDVVGYFPGPS